MHRERMLVWQYGKFTCIRAVLVGLTGMFLVACQKQIPVSDNSLSIGTLRLSTSKVVLLQGNQNNNAFTMEWEIGGNNSRNGINFIIEACVKGTHFDNIIELGATTNHKFMITIKELNSKLLSFLTAGEEAEIAIRVKSEQLIGNNSVIYSDPISLTVKPFQFLCPFDESRVIRIPGNYQNWSLSTAPFIQSAKQNGEFEGYLNFSDPFTQFLMVKGSQWEPNLTYSYIGSNKFGFGGTVLSVFGGKGIYLLQANTNSNTWHYTKIESWGLHGTAVYDVNNGNKDQLLNYDFSKNTWRIVTELAAGNFRIRANNNDAISFGQSKNGEPGVPDYDGTDIKITKAGMYMVTLKLDSPGNYYYAVQRII